MTNLDRHFDIVGDRFGRLTVLRKMASGASVDGTALYECRCDCGETVMKHRSSLHATLSSCGKCDSTTWTEKIKVPRATTNRCRQCKKLGHTSRTCPEGLNK